MSRPNPTERPPTGKIRHALRTLAVQDVDCVHRPKCVDKAIRRGWDGFDCTNCDAYAREQPIPAYCYGRGFSVQALVEASGGAG